MISSYSLLQCGFEGGTGAGGGVSDYRLDPRGFIGGVVILRYELLLLAIATSIDALAVGVTFAFLDVNIVPAVTLIGVTTFVISFGGVVIGHQFGSRWEKASTVAGGIILICIGIKIVLDHFLG